MSESITEWQERMVVEFATMMFRIAEQQGKREAFKHGTTVVNFLQELTKDYDGSHARNIDLPHDAA
jgi:hypothetical protein